MDQRGVQQSCRPRAKLSSCRVLPCSGLDMSELGFACGSFFLSSGFSGVTSASRSRPRAHPRPPRGRPHPHEAPVTAALRSGSGGTAWSLGRSAATREGELAGRAGGVHVPGNHRRRRTGSCERHWARAQGSEGWVRGGRGQPGLEAAMAGLWIKNPDEWIWEEKINDSYQVPGQRAQETRRGCLRVGRWTVM